MWAAALQLTGSDSWPPCASHTSALVIGLHGAFVAAVIAAGLGIVVALTLIRRDELEPGAEQVEAEPALEVAA